MRKFTQHLFRLNGSEREVDTGQLLTVFENTNIKLTRPPTGERNEVIQPVDWGVIDSVRRIDREMSERIL
jgi:hypothetical protein